MMKSTLKYVVSCTMAFQGFVLLTPNIAVADKVSSGIETTGSSQNASVKDGADKSSSANKGAQAQQILSGAMMFAMAAQKYSECSVNKSACVMAAIFTGMGVLSMAQSREHGNAAYSSGITSSQSDGLGKNPYGNTDINLNDPNNPLNKDPSVKAMGANMKKLSAVYDAKTGKIKTPDGKSYNASDFSSQSAMAAAGVPNGAIMGGMAAYDAVQKKAASKVDKLKLGAMTAASGFDEGGSGSGSAVVVTEESPAYAGGGGVGLGSGLDRDPSSLAGMQKNYNGEPIGVAADSIFLMMNRRYKVKESQESFFTDADLLLQK